MPLPAFLAAAAKLAVLVVAAATAANAASFARYRRRHLRRIPNPIDEAADPIADFRALPSAGAGAGADDASGLVAPLSCSHNRLVVVSSACSVATAPAHVEDRLEDAWLQFATEHSCDDKEAVRDHKTADAVMASAAGDGGAQLASMSRREGAESDSDDNCSHNVAAWHNVPCPQERLKFWSDPETELKLAKETGISVFRMGIDWTRVMPKEPTDEQLKSSVNFAALERYRWIIQRVHEYGMKVMLTLFHHSLPPWAGEYGGWKMEKTVKYFMDFVRLVVDSVSDLVDYWVVFNEPHVFVMLTYCAGAWPGGDPNAIEVATSALPTGVYNQALHWMAIAHAEAYDYIHLESKNERKPIVGVAHHVSFTRPYGLFDVAAVTLANSMTLFPYIDSICDKLDFIGINYYGQEVISGPGLKLVDNDEYSESGRGVYPDGLFRGVRVLGYLFWTTSDNWEWADGYGPKFGLVAVDRANNLARKPRPSYYLFSKVCADFSKLYWGLDRPIQRPFILRDWRFGHYEMEGLQDP
ncbi:hypothetical protein HU200_066444 [Digitaria exilis]|uniref:Beta-glucosidase n=1 Tax=Digitaria exilis TaxID=1010633 RepID=A0A834ZWL3_9POAL|nr:hypothetical protein HU200_066444 [Digitaria exilis]